MKYQDVAVAINRNGYAERSCVLACYILPLINDIASYRRHTLYRLFTFTNPLSLGGVLVSFQLRHDITNCFTVSLGFAPDLQGVRKGKDAETVHEFRYRLRIFVGIRPPRRLSV